MVTANVESPCAAHIRDLLNVAIAVALTWSLARAFKVRKRLSTDIQYLVAILTPRAFIGSRCDAGGLKNSSYGYEQDGAYFGGHHHLVLPNLDD